MKYTLLKLLYFLLYFIGIFKLFYFLNRHKQIVITYHNIIPDAIYDNDLVHLGVSCSENIFIKQINIIAARFDMSTEVGIPGTCIISFDDGYKNNIEIAAKILSKNNIDGLFFIPACYYESLDALWVDQLLMWVSYCPVGCYLILDQEFLIAQNCATRNALWEFLYQTLLSNYCLLKPLINELNNHYSFDQLRALINNEMFALRFTPMSSDEIELLKKGGHKIGCHSYKHDILSLLTDEQLEHDFLICKSYSKKYNSNYYSYPFGGIDEISQKVIEKCKENHYSAAFLNYENKNKDIYSLGRVSLGNKSNKYCIEAQLCGFENMLKKIMKSAV